MPALVIALASVAHAAAYLVAAPEHVVDPSWPAHARFHVLQALLWIVLLDLALAALALGPLRRGSRSALPALAIGGLGAHGAYFAAMLAIPEGRPPELSSHLILGGVALVFIVGLGLAWRDDGPVAVPPRR